MSYDYFFFNSDSDITLGLIENNDNTMSVYDSETDELVGHIEGQLSDFGNYKEGGLVDMNRINDAALLANIQYDA